MSKIPTILHLSDPAVFKAMRDFATVQRWEVLKRRRVPLTAQEFADACSISLAEAVETLDTLVEAGFAVRNKATARCRHMTYEIPDQDILVVWHNDHEDDRRFVADTRMKLRQYSQHLIDNARRDGLDFPIRGGITAERYRSLRINHAEQTRVYAILQRAFDAIAEIDEEAQQAEVQRKTHESIREKTHERAHDSPPAAEPDPRRDYILTLHFLPTHLQTFPIPRINLVQSTILETRRAAIAARPGRILTRREMQVASRLAGGQSRPEVAKSLGVSANTVATMTKRIYAKLGVRSRAECAARMKAFTTT